MIGAEGECECCEAAEELFGSYFCSGVCCTRCASEAEVGVRPLFPVRPDELLPLLEICKLLYGIWSPLFELVPVVVPSPLHPNGEEDPPPVSSGVP